MSSFGIVIIGRNEGFRLKACLESLEQVPAPVVYVDSESSDGSVSLARREGVEVISLDAGKPLSAARARNEGIQRLLGGHPELRYVQFVDGDCIVEPKWFAKAIDALEINSDVAAVCGCRRERFPGRSIYNRLVDLEWNAPAGEAQSCGGDAMFRASAFASVGGFNPSVVAGEEPELCHRLRLAGWRIRQIDAEMTWHDADMRTFAQWWTRQVRTGYGALDVVRRFDVPLFLPIVRSARMWGLGWPLSTMITALIGGITVGPYAAAIALGMSAMVGILQSVRVARRVWSRADGRTAVVYGILTLLGKLAQLFGQCKCRWAGLLGRRPELLEYKTAPHPAAA